MEWNPAIKKSFFQKISNDESSLISLMGKILKGDTPILVIIPVLYVHLYFLNSAKLPTLDTDCFNRGRQKMGFPDVVRVAMLSPVGSDSHLSSWAHHWCHHAATSGFTFHANITTLPTPASVFSFFSLIKSLWLGHMSHSVLTQVWILTTKIKQNQEHHGSAWCPDCFVTWPEVAFWEAPLNILLSVDWFSSLIRAGGSWW